MPNPAIWSCKIGEVDRAKLPHGSDAPLRKAVQDCYRELTGEDDTYIFSGWGAKLDEAERAVLENRLPDPEVIRDELTAQLEILPVAWAESDAPRESHAPSPDLFHLAVPESTWHIDKPTELRWPSTSDVALISRPLLESLCEQAGYVVIHGKEPRDLSG